MSQVIGVDIGGTTTRAIRFGADRAVEAESSVSTGVGGGDELVRSALAAIAAVGDAPAAVGIGVPGQVDVDTGTVRLAVNLGLGEEPYPLGPAIADALQLPVTVENDVRAAALGVSRVLADAGTPVESLALLSIGTGISAGIVIGGAIYRGANGMAGEIGHVVVAPDGPTCRCGLKGCLEAVASGPALARSWPHGEPARIMEALLEADRAGDAPARRVLTDLTARLASAIHWLAAAYDVELIFLGGGVASSGTSFLMTVRRALEDLARGSDLAARTLRPERVVLVPAGEPIGARGAAALALAQLERFAASTNP